MSSAHDHRKSGHRESPPKRETVSLDKALIDFLEARGAYQRGRQSIDFRSAKNRLDRRRAA